MKLMSWSSSSSDKHSLLLHPKPFVASSGRGTNLSVLEPDEPKPFVASSMLILWNVALVIVSAVILVRSFVERPNEPLRIWIYGFDFLRLTRVMLILCEYWRRNTDIVYLEDHSDNSTFYRFCPKLDVNNVVSIIWWIIGVFLVIKGGGNLLSDAPNLFWLSVFLQGIVVIMPVLSICFVGIVLYFDL